jgi:hypothetical protein
VNAEDIALRADGLSNLIRQSDQRVAWSLP